MIDFSVGASTHLPGALAYTTPFKSVIHTTGLRFLLFPTHAVPRMLERRSLAHCIYRPGRRRLCEREQSVAVGWHEWFNELQTVDADRIASERQHHGCLFESYHIGALVSNAYA
jgi:hypothetical protein